MTAGRSANTQRQRRRRTKPLPRFPRTGPRTGRPARLPERRWACPSSSPASVSPATPDLSIAAAARLGRRDAGRGRPTSTAHAERSGRTARRPEGGPAEHRSLCRPLRGPNPESSRPWIAAPSPRSLALLGVVLAPTSAAADALEKGRTFGSRRGEASKQDAAASTAFHFRSEGFGSASHASLLAIFVLLPRSTGRGGICSILLDRNTIYYQFETSLLPVTPTLASSSSHFPAIDVVCAPRPQGLSGGVVCGQAGGGPQPWLPCSVQSR